jgi:potassium efflux system protein
MRRLLLFALLIGFAAAAYGQEQEEGDWVRPDVVPTRGDELLRDLEAIAPAPEKHERLDQLERELARRAPGLDELVARVDAALAASAPLDELVDLRRELAAEAKWLEGSRAELEAEGSRVAALLERLASAEARWSTTLTRPETAEAGEVVERRARSALDAVVQTSASLRALRSRTLAVEDRMAEHRKSVTAALARVDEAASAQRSTLLVPDRDPLTHGRFWQRLAAELPRVSQALADFSAENLDFLRRDARPLIVQLLLAVLLALAVRQAGRAARARAGRAAASADATRLLERPFSIALLLALLATPWIHPLAPRRFNQLLALIALLPVARIVTHVSRETNRLVLVGLFGMLLLDRLGLAVQALPAVAQIALLLQTALGLAVALRVLRRGGLPGPARRVRGAARIVVAALGVALLAQLGGWGELATLLGRGSLVLALLGVYVWAAVVAVDALLAWLYGSTRWGARSQRAQRRARWVVRWVAGAVWLYAALGSIGLREPAAEALGRVLAAGISVGALSLTLGGVLAFLLAILAAPFAARFIDFVLQEAVYPRAQLPRGMPYALSTLVRYAVFALAFLAALAAAGVQLSQLSILLGGLGVGVGLGLQDVVKNFAAGLTLLFERRVHVGDVVQLPGGAIFGRVLEIGMRAALVRNWDGAEVVVPNADLVSGAVTNWTLSDQLRRIELPVGVAYGTDPERVVELLLKVARGHGDVVAEPPPQALFQGFGESSLDFLLRAWSDAVYDRTLAIRSELALATHRALSEAGITIPFPQRDLHLASVSAAARADLRGKERP